MQFEVDDFLVLIVLWGAFEPGREDIMRIMVSACLLGENCKYNGGNNNHEILKRHLQKQEVMPVCPEVEGGLPIPREPAEIVDGIVKTKSGKIVDAEFQKGAGICLEKAKTEHIDAAILQSRSPSCGVNQIYDGTFSRRKIPGSGIFAKLLQEEGIRTIDIEDMDEIVSLLETNDDL